MAKDPAFSFYAQDFLVDTVQWSRAAKGLHCELLSIAWINGTLEANAAGEPLELDDEGLQLWRTRVHKKWKLVAGHLTNEKLEEVRAKRKNFKDNQSVKGKKSAERRLESEPDLNRTTNQNPTTVQPESPVEPLEYEKEQELVTEEKNKASVPENKSGDEVIISPFPSDFVVHWQRWKDYKLKEHKFRYKSTDSEQTALKHLGKLSNKDPGVAADLIDNAIAMAWMGIYPLKNTVNGTGQGNTAHRKPGTSEARIDRAKNW